MTTPSIEERVARLEAIIEDIRRELTQIHAGITATRTELHDELIATRTDIYAHMNTDRLIYIGLWITTIIAVVGGTLLSRGTP